MIEINLLPDVKREFLAAQRARTKVISLAVLVGIIAVGCVTALAIWAFGVQTVHGSLLDATIKEENATLSTVEDLSNTLTIQSQLASLTTLNENKTATSRVFDIIQKINPPAPNDMTISTLTLDSQLNTLKIEGQAAAGYQALETFKKTISATNVVYTTSSNSEAKTIPLVTDVVESGTSYGQDSSGQKVLRFTMTLTYSKEVLLNSSNTISIQGPIKTDATDSFRRLPASIFANPATDIKEQN